MHLLVVVTVAFDAPSLVYPFWSQQSDVGGTLMFSVSSVHLWPVCSRPL